MAASRRPGPARILDTALALAEEGHWEGVRLYRVAGRLGVGLAEIQRHFREKEDLVDAWFDRADRAMLKTMDEAAGNLPPADRIETAIGAWLDAIAPHRRVTREMLAVRAEPGHLHIQIPTLLRVSRTVQWIREAGGQDATFLRRAVEETALTGVFVATVAGFLTDDSPGQEKTRRRLHERLHSSLLPLSGSN